MTSNTGVRPETFKEQCSSLASKFRRWPNLSDQDLLEINDDIEKLVDKLVAKARENDLTTLIAPVENMGAGSKDGLGKEESTAPEG